MYNRNISVAIRLRFHYIMNVIPVYGIGINVYIVIYN